MINFNKNTLIISVLAFALTVIGFALLPFLSAVNVIAFPVLFTIFAVLISKIGKLPIRERGDVHAIALVMLVLSSGLIMLDILLNGKFSVYSFILVAMYALIPHILLSVIFGVNRVEKTKK